MRPKSRLATVALVLAAALSATGCTPEAPAADPVPTPSATPLFASDAEALAAAEEAYAAYLAVTDAIFADGGKDPERLLEVATREVFEAQLEGYVSAANEGWTGVGSTTLDSVTLERYDPGNARSTVSIYGCVDLSEVDVVDSSGVSVVSPTRPNRTPIQATLDSSGGARFPLIVSGERPWTGENFCV
jgi:hypothetical protein